MSHVQKIVVTGAAGLVGQNLILQLRESGFSNIVAIDKQRNNLALLEKINPGVRTIYADVAELGDWQVEFSDCDAAVILHAQITAKDRKQFERNNLLASELVYESLRKASVPYTIQVSSSVVNSVAVDDYTDTKRAQEQMFLQSGLQGCVLRPTLMYGWFDPKHLGWLAKFMEQSPLFPVPGHGKYARQPLYERDFCRALIWCIENRPIGKVFDLVGSEYIDYIDIVREIRKVRGLRTPIVRIPYRLFDLLLRIYARFSDTPPFTSAQLKALTAGDRFTGIDFEPTFGFAPTPFRDGIRETFCHPIYSSYMVERTD